MKNLVLLLSVVLALFSCAKEQENKAVPENVAFLGPKPQNLNRQEVPAHLLALNDLGVGDAVDLKLKGNLFGKFFNNRASFFIIEKPTNKIYNSRVKSITMYFLDEQLSQAKYVLEENVLDSLIKANGKFKIKGFDLRNRDILTLGEGLTKTDEGYVLNTELDNFEIKWTVGDTQIKYRLNMYEEEPFIYTERLANYETNFREIERSAW